jgi:RhtB (resistance to homoserine/threonine) family protein
MFTAWLMLASVNLAATMSPGPAFAITVKSSIAHGRRGGLMTVLGLGVGILIHVSLVLGGVAVLISNSPLLYNILRYSGAAYLFYLGVKAWLKKPAARTDEKEIIAAHEKISDFGAFRIGAVASILNPKSLVFFLAVYSQFVAPGTPWHILALYGLTSIVIEIAWFSVVAFILTDPRIKRRFLAFSRIIARVCGGLLILIGIRLVLE